MHCACISIKNYLFFNLYLVISTKPNFYTFSNKINKNFVTSKVFKLKIIYKTL